ncbi:O-antigen polymerase [uncultured Clostridium sp.]|uniref:O-antigen polymerase n=1 Tax=uncultured Clostridium sp. TaxID=59620 RepID=UPI003217135F
MYKDKNNSLKHENMLAQIKDKWSKSLMYNRLIGNLGQNKLKNIYIFYCIVYKIALDLIYVWVISPLYSYNGLVTDINLFKIVESYFLLILSTSTLELNKYKISSYYNVILHSLTLIPLLCLYGVMDETRSFTYISTIAFIIIFYLSKKELNLNKFKIKVGFRKFKKSINKSYTIAIVFVSSLTIVTYILLYKKVGFSINLNFSNIYDLRSSFSEVLKNSSIFRYLFVWQSNVLNMFLLGLFIIKKKYYGIGVVGILQLWLFSSNGSKTTFFNMAFCIVVIYIYIKKKEIYNFVKFILATQLVTSFIYLITKNINILGIASYRLIYIPAQVAFYHNDFFQKNGFLHLSYSIMKRFIDYPYSIEPSRVIGVEYFNSINMNANTNFLGDAYMNFGLLGIIVFSIAIGLTFNIINKISLKKNKLMCLSITITPIFLLTNGAFLTTILTYGLGIGILLLLLMPNEVL